MGTWYKQMHVHREGCGSPILDYKLVRVYVRIYGKIILLWKGTKIKDLRVIFYFVMEKKDMEKVSLDSQRGNLKASSPPCTLPVSTRKKQ